MQNLFRKPSDSSPQGPATISNNSWMKASLRWRGSIKTVLTQCKNMMGLPEQAVEKDYWVTVMLQLIFDSELMESMAELERRFRE